MKLDVQNLTYGYSADTVVFHDISFTLKEGDNLFLLGPNGAGKTTLFKAVLGIVKPHAGKIFLDGSDIADWPRKKMAQSISYVPQHHNPPFAFSVLEVVLMGRTPHLDRFQMPSAADEKIALDSLDHMGLLDLKEKSYTQISGGERQLVLIARALTQQPRILILDEPTSNLDYGNQFRVMNYLKDLTKRGIAVITSTHIPDHAMRYGTKAVLIKDGILAAYGNPETVITKESLRHLYDIEAELIPVSGDGSDSFKVCVPY